MPRTYLMRKILLRKRKLGTNGKEIEEWESLANAIELKDVFDYSVEKGIGKFKDKFSLRIMNNNNRLNVTKYSGNGSSTDYVLKYAPIPESYLGTEKFKNYPITRKGIIAQTISNENEFIMDGFASHGNSGSPVYCLVNDSLKLLGIQKAVYNDTNIGYDENGNVNSLVSFNSGLSIVIKASVIKDFLYDLIDKGKYKGDWSD